MTVIAIVKITRYFTSELENKLKQTCMCDEWGGAESRGSRARPVELMIMSDTCTTHRSDDSARGDQAWTLFCVLCAAVVREGLLLYFCVCLFLLLNY